MTVTLPSLGAYMSKPRLLRNACKLAASRTELLRKTAVGIQACREGRGTAVGVRPWQGSPASKQDSNTMNTALAATAVDRGSVYVKCGGEWESAAVRPGKQRGRGRCLGQPTADYATVPCTQYSSISREREKFSGPGKFGSH